MRDKFASDSIARRPVTIAAALCASSLVCSAGMAKPLYTHFLFFPKRAIKSEPEQINGVARQTVTIPVGEQHLSGWLFQKSDSPYVVLVNHGNSGNISSVKWIAHNLLSAGVSVMVYDYRGYGTSSHYHPDVSSVCDDGQAAYSFLVNEKSYKPENIILYGQSLGCAVACHISKHNQVKAMILQSGFSSLRNCAYQRFPFLQKTPLIPDALDNASILSQTNLPLLLIHGNRDRVVPFENVHQLYRAAVGQKWLVVCENSGHKLYPESDTQHRSAVCEFIARVMGQEIALAQPHHTPEETAPPVVIIKKVDVANTDVKAVISSKHSTAYSE